jgi:hypothetical protein
MAIFRECKHSFQIVQALFGKSASTLVFSASSKGTAFASVPADIVCECNAAIKREQWKACFPIAEREKLRPIGQE